MMKTYFLIPFASILMMSCGNNQQPTEEQTTEAPSTEVNAVADYDPKRGEGRFSAENVIVGNLNNDDAKKGEAIANTKCTSCHKLTDEKLVGPGWMGVTKRYEPYWIMNFITNPDPMIDKDPKVQAQLEICLVRMPNQNLSDDEARQILEFMRKNDGINP